MFPNLRLLLAGVSALFLVTLGALSLTHSPSDRIPVRVATAAFVSHGAMLRADDGHSEIRRVLAEDALRRAGELEKLRGLPDRQDKAPLRWVSLPGSAQDHAPEEAAEELAELPSAAIPVEIGEASSTELPVLQKDDPLPVIAPLRSEEPAEAPKAVPAEAEDSRDTDRAATINTSRAPMPAGIDAKQTETKTVTPVKPEAAEQTKHEKNAKAETEEKSKVQRKRTAKAVKPKPRRAVRRPAPSTPAPLAQNTANPLTTLFSPTGNP